VLESRGTVGVAEPVVGSIELTIAVGNFQTLPDNTWVNVWFDLDSDPETGEGGDEALVRYLRMAASLSMCGTVRSSWTARPRPLPRASLPGHSHCRCRRASWAPRRVSGSSSSALAAGRLRTRSSLPPTTRRTAGGPRSSGQRRLLFPMERFVRSGGKSVTARFSFRVR